MKTVRLLLPAWALALAACQSVPAPADPARAAIAAREAQLTDQWKSHRYSELIAARGRPLRLLDIPGGGNPPGFVAVYPRDPASGCLDAFALVYGPDPLIRAYRCY